MKLGKLLLATASVVVLVGALAAGASARSFSVSNQNWRAQFRSLGFRGILGTYFCQVTMEGSFHSRTIAKRRGQLIGFVTRAALGPCSLGTATLLTAGLPWHVQYFAFTGSLPNITSVQMDVIGLGLLVRTIEGLGCLAVTTSAQPGQLTFYREVGGRVFTTAEMFGTIETTCGFAGTFSSDFGPVTLLGSTTTRITVTLI